MRLGRRPFFLKKQGIEDEFENFLKIFGFFWTEEGAHSSLLRHWIQEAVLNEFSDDILVEASRRGDKSAYALLVKRHYREVFAVCLGILGNVHDGEDIAQDVMLKGFLKLRELRGSEQFGQWIVRIAKNLCIDFVRRKRHLRTFGKKQAAGAARKTPENHDVRLAISRLPQEYRLPLVMYYFDNKSAKAIAAKLKISRSGVCQRIRVAREQLHRLLTKEVQK